MIKKLIISTLLLATTSSFASFHHKRYHNPVVDRIDDFVDEMIEKHDFDGDYLDDLFAKIELSDTVIEKMTTPYESKPWYKYRELFITESRITNGVEYWENHKKALARAEKEYGVPASVIIAILGVETKYGASKGDFPVLQALSTLAFNYPPRSSFFKKELEEYLLLTEELDVDPQDIKGSYAGAIGLPQFMPSSYRHYAVPHHRNKASDLVNNDDDAILSIANYLKKNGWVSHQPIAIKAKLETQDYKTLVANAKFLPTHTVESLSKQGIKPQKKLDNQTQVTLVEYETENGHEYWLGLKNFIAITRYNKHKHYVLAVYELSEKIKQERNKLLAAKSKPQQSTLLDQLLTQPNIATKT